MFPLRDVHKPDRPPFVTRLLVTLNVLAFIYQWLNWTVSGQDVVMTMGVVPKCYVLPGSCGISVFGQSDELWKPLLVSMFLHGGVLHLAFNMLFLAVFGAGVEDKLGRFRYLMVYLGCGLAASAAHIVTHPLSMVPTIGASGAIAGILGAYLILLPRSWILTYLPPIFIFPVPAPVFLIVWIAGQVVSFFTNLPFFSPGHGGDDIAWVAHLGGFAAGAAVGWAVKPWWKSKASAAGS
jgi:membrane associated rhomboid family serine protease